MQSWVFPFFFCFRVFLPEGVCLYNFLKGVSTYIKETAAGWQLAARLGAGREVAQAAAESLTHDTAGAEQEAAVAPRGRGAPGRTGRSHAANTAKTSTFTARGCWARDSLCAARPAGLCERAPRFS